MGQIQTSGSRASVVSMRVAGAGLLACIGYLIGTQVSLEREAMAVPGSSNEPYVTVNNIAAPALVLTENERAIVGAADGVFYLVDYDGNAAEVRAARTERRDPYALFWHPGPVQH